MKTAIKLILAVAHTLVTNGRNFRLDRETVDNGSVLMASIKAEGLKFPPETFTNEDGAQEIARGFGRMNALLRLREEFPAWWKENYPKDQIPVYSHGKLTREEVTALKNDYGRPISKAGAYLLYRDLRDCGNKIKAAIVRMLSPLQQAFGVGREIDAKLTGQERLDAYTKRYYGTVSQGFEYIRDFRDTIVEVMYLENVDLARRDFRMRAESIRKLHNAYKGDCESEATNRHKDTGLLPESQKCWVQLAKDAAADKAKGSKNTEKDDGSGNAEVVKFKNGERTTFAKMVLDRYMGKPVENWQEYEEKQLAFEATNPFGGKVDSDAQAKSA